MENYQKAYDFRMLDVDALLATAPPRRTAAAHLGGIAVECRLKSLILLYHNLTAWGEPSRRVGDPRYRVQIERTSHALVAAVKLMDVLYKKARTDHHFIKHLNNINYPIGATGVDFIALRYSSSEIDPVAHADWRRSLDYVLGWLDKNEKLI